MNVMAHDFTGIDHVQIAVPEGSEAECRDFYLGVLGMAEVERPSATAGRSFLWVGIGPQQIHFRTDAEYTPARLAHPAFVVSGLDALAARIAAAGHEVSRGDAIGPGRFHIRDPFGNRIEFIERPR